MTEEPKLTGPSVPRSFAKSRSRILLPAHRKRSYRVVIPVNQAELERYHDAAIKAEQSLSAWVRDCCEKAIQQK